MVKFHTLSKTNYKFGFGLFTSDLRQFHLVQSTKKMKSIYLNVNVSINIAKMQMLNYYLCSIDCPSFSLKWVLSESLWFWLLSDSGQKHCPSHSIEF